MLAAVATLVVAMGVRPAVAAPPAAASRLQITTTGAIANGEFGFSVSAGDLNGDGFRDLIVGSGSAGRAHVYYGGPGADAVADLTLIGEPPGGDNFGRVVSSAGDVNGDGFEDLIVGAGRNDAGGGDAGRAYVYYGGLSPDAVADLTLTGAATGDLFGDDRSVSSAGDVNGDGFADVVVGARSNDAGGVDAGRAYVYFGGPGADAVADLTLTGAAAGDQFGFSVASAGDVNGDGYGDIIVGAPTNDAGGGDAGRAYVYYGGRIPDGTADLLLTGGEVSGDFGLSVASAGDVNGDGYPDVIVGAHQSDAGGVDAGAAFVYYGGPNADASADRTMIGAAANDHFGFSVASAGDVNGDGFADMIVGAIYNDLAGVDAGRAYVFYGGPGADVVPDLMLTGEAAGDIFGYWVASAGDVTGDGIDDLIVGAPGNDAGGVTAGRAYLYNSNRYFLLSPNGGETWNVGAMKTVSWVGAERADVWLSADGGNSFSLLESGVGGSPSNAVSIRVPHTPSRFAMFRVTPSDPAIGGSDKSDSLFTIQTSVALLSLLAAPVPGGGASITWSTDPGPDGLSGYRVERSAAGTAGWRTLVALTRETSVTDPQGGPGTQYRLFAVNGFGEELWLGEASLRPLAPLGAWPLPYRGGPLTISFATFGGLGGGLGSAEVSVFDVSGRLVRRIARGSYGAGYQVVSWDGRDEQGRRVSSGIYFLKAKSAGEERTLKLAVAR